MTLAAATLLATGCGSKNKLHKVEGTVTYDGKPLAGATVQFVPLDSNGTTANGMTGDDGSFRLTTHSTGDGAKPGDYKKATQRVYHSSFIEMPVVEAQ